VAKVVSMRVYAGFCTVLQDDLTQKRPQQPVGWETKGIGDKSTVSYLLRRVLSAQSAD